MLAESGAIYLLTAGLTLLAMLGFVWAVAQDQLKAGPDQASVIFADDELRTRRPWESPLQHAERQARYGEPLPPRPGQWGGSR